MSFHRKARVKPHKVVIERMKEKYFQARDEVRRRSFTKEQEVELCYLQDEIDRRWFRFFADHYIDDTIKAYVSLVESAPLKK